MGSISEELQRFSLQGFSSPLLDFFPMLSQVYYCQNYRLKLSSLPKVCPDKNFKFRVTGHRHPLRTRHVAPVAVGSPGRSPETGPPTGSGAVYVDHRQLGNVGDAPVRDSISHIYLSCFARDHPGRISRAITQGPYARQGKRPGTSVQEWW